MPKFYLLSIEVFNKKSKMGSTRQISKVFLCSKKGNFLKKTKLKTRTNSQHKNVKQRTVHNNLFDVKIVKSFFSVRKDSVMEIGGNYRST